jgi:nucleoside phosphorylase
MPAYHLIAPNGEGITLVNIGVGPSNAKTICDHLAVMRPEVWLMIGHCGGLRPSQTIGDYVLAHGYLRDDHVLDDVLPVEIPLPAIAEIQQALFRAAIEVTGEDPQQLKSGCALALSSPPTTATGIAASPCRRYASTSRGRSRSTWNRPPSPPRAIASGRLWDALMCVRQATTRRN